MSGLAPGDLTVDVRREATTTVIAPRGELDIATVGRMTAALDELDPDSVELVIDLRGLSFMDSSGLRGILAARRKAEENGQRLSIIRGTGPVDDVIRLTGVDATLPLVDPEDDRGGEGTPIG